MVRQTFAALGFLAAGDGGATRLHRRAGIDLLVLVARVDGGVGGLVLDLRVVLLLLDGGVGLLRVAHGCTPIVGGRAEDFGPEGSDGVLRRHHRIDQADLDRIVRLIHTGLRVANRLFGHPAINSNHGDELLPHAVETCLHVGTHVVGQRVEGIAVDLVLAGMDEGDGDAELFERLAHVDVHGQHTNAATVARRRRDHTLRGTAERIRARHRTRVDDRQRRLRVAALANVLGQLEVAVDHAAAGVDVEHDARHVRVGHRGVELAADVVVAARAVPRVAVAVYERAAHRDEGKAVAEKERLGTVAWEGNVERLLDSGGDAFIRLRALLGGRRERCLRHRHAQRCDLLDITRVDQRRAAVESLDERHAHREQFIHRRSPCRYRRWRPRLRCSMRGCRFLSACLACWC